MPEQAILDVGADKQFHTINAAIAAANAMGGNADIRIAAGTYVNDGGSLADGINNVTIEGVGGMVIISDSSFNAGGKAAIVVGGQNIVLRNLDISGVTVPDGNGAAVRYDGGTLLLEHVHFHGNQNGLLGAPDPAGTITIRNSEFDRNGTEAGNTHNIYVGDIATFTLTDSYIHDANVGHEVKSRAENTVITGNYILDNAGSSSYSIDLPNGGNATITGNVIEQGANNQNRTINAYGEEGNLHSGNTVVFSNNTVINDDPNGAGSIWANNGASISGSGNMAWHASSLGSGVNPAGFTQLSARPTIDVPPQGAGVSGPSAPDDAASEPTSVRASGPMAGPTNGSTTGSTSGPSNEPVGGQQPAPNTPVPTFRFFDTIHGTQFLTSSSAERDAIIAGQGTLTYEGTGMGAVTLDPADANVASVYRFFDTSSGTHFFTTSAGERDSIVATRPDLIEEQANFAEHLSPADGDVGVYRFFNNGSGDHFFTQSATERATILATRADMVDEGIAFYAPGRV